MSVNFSDQLREDLLVTALEGGSNYWYLFSDKDAEDVLSKTEKGSPFSIRVWQYIKEGNALAVYDLEDEEELLGVFSLQSIEEGEKIMFENFFSHYSDAKEENWDAETADVWFQLCLMKDVVFG